MDEDYLFKLCGTKKASCWDEVRMYLASDASKEEKKQQIYRDQHQDASLSKLTCLHRASRYDAPYDIGKSLIDIGGGRELVMVKACGNRTALHYACWKAASYNIMKMLIDVGGKDLVMVKDSRGFTALQYLCCNINERDNTAPAKIKLILEAADTDEILQTKNDSWETPLQMATREKASTEIQNLLRPNRPSTAVLNNGNAATEPNKRRKRPQVTPRKQCTTASPTTPPEGTNILLDTIRQLQEQLDEANDRAAQIQRDFADKRTSCMNLLEQLEDANNKAALNQRNFDEKCAEVVDLKEVGWAAKLTWANTLLQKDKDFEKVQTEHNTLQQQKRKTDEDNVVLKRHADTLTKTCSEQMIKLHEMEDAANAIETAAGRKRKRTIEGNKNDECSTTPAALSSTSSSSAATVLDSADTPVLSQRLSKRRRVLAGASSSRISSELGRIWRQQVSSTKKQFRSAKAQVMELLK